MTPLQRKLLSAPVPARVAPFVLFAGLTLLQGKLGPTSVFWVYLLKTMIGVGLVWLIYPVVTEMRYKFSAAAVWVGIGVFVMWVGLDDLFRWAGLRDSYPKLAAAGPPWNPFVAFGADSALAWSCVVGRILGSSLVVPCMEEVFYRSFMYRYLVKPDLLSVEMKYFAWMPFTVTSLIFGLAHSEWLAGVLCGFAYQGLVLWKNRLGDAMTAHAITNFLLGLWIVWQGAWHFW